MLGYVLAYVMFRRNCTRSGNMIEEDQRWLIIATAAIGALIGSRMLGLMEQVFRLHITWGTFLLPGGRTTVGGLLGAWIALGLIKRLRDVRGRAGDLFAGPLSGGT